MHTRAHPRTRSQKQAADGNQATRPVSRERERGRGPARHGRRDQEGEGSETKKGEAGQGETKEQGDQERERKEGEVGVGPQLVQLLLGACLCCGAATILCRLQACLALRVDSEDRRDQGEEKNK